MTSQISTRKLIRLEMKQCSWMFALSALVQFLAGPVYYLLTVDISLSESKLRDHIYIYGRLAGFYDNGYFLIHLLAIMIAIGFCLFSYRYLFSKRMMDLYHSVPITRSKLFWTKYLHGFLVWFLPFSIGSFTVLIISLIRLSHYAGFYYAVMLIKAWAGSTLLLLFCYFIFYHLFLVAAYLSGNILNWLTNTIIMGISVTCIYALIISFAECYFETFCQLPSTQQLDLLVSLSPLITPFYVYYMLRQRGLTVLMQQHPVFWVTSLLFTFVLLLVAIYLCKKRPSELAERGTLHKFYKIPARIAATFLAILAVSLFFSQLVSSSLRLLWGIFGALLGGILCFGALNSIYHTTIRSFFKNLPQMLGITGLGTLLILAIHFDWFGYDAYLPDKEDIAGMAIYTTFGENTSSILINTDSSRSSWRYNDENYVIYQENLLTDKDICYNFLNMVINDEKEEGFCHLYAKIQLENGRTYYRQYYINNSDYQALAPFVETEDYKYTNYKASTGLMGYPESAEIDCLSSDRGIVMNGSGTHELMDAYMADFEEHYNLEELSSYFCSYRIELKYTNAEGEYFYCYLPVPDNYERTLHLVQEYDISSLDSPEQITSVIPHISTADIMAYGTVHNYFAATGNTASATSNQNEAATASAQTSFHISDPEWIAELYPILYFGSYGSPFELRDYIYLGEVHTIEDDYVSAWVKPSTLPEKFIEMIAEELADAATE